MTTKAKPTAEPSAQDNLVAAEARFQTATKAVDDARTGITNANQALAQAETEAVEAMSAATIDGDTPAARTRVEKARQKVEKARADIDWAALQLNAAENAYAKTQDDLNQAQRVVIAEEYISEHKAFNDPQLRETVLLQQLTDTIAELVPLIKQRQDWHHRLATEVNHFPHEERPAVPAGRPITTYPHRGQGTWLAHLPLADLAEAIQTGLTHAEETAKAETQQRIYEASQGTA